MPNLQVNLESIFITNSDGNPSLHLEISKEENWYDEFCQKVDAAIKEARAYLLTTEESKATDTSQVSDNAGSPYRLKKLECPKFYSDPKQFHRWKETFERFTTGYNNETKYDYLFTHTEGEAHAYVANRRSYSDAMHKLDEKYGNIHDIVAILIDEVKGLAVTRKCDLSSFETLSLKVNDFQ